MPPPGRVPLGTAPMAARAQGTAPLAGWQLSPDGRDPGSPRSLPMPEAGRLPDTFGPVAVAPGSPAPPATGGPARMPGQAPRHVPPMPASPVPAVPLAVPPGERVADRPMPPEWAAPHAPDPHAPAPAVAAAPPPPAGAMQPPSTRPGPPAQLTAQPETADAIRAAEAGAEDLPGLANAGTDPARLGATPASVHGVEIPRHVARQLAEALVPRPDGPVELRLNPEELGHVRITLSGDDGSMIVLVHADREDTAALMRRNADLLQQELRAAGYPDANLSFSSGDTPGQDRGAPPRSPEPAPTALAAARDHGVAIPGPAPSPGTARDRLDLRL
ncbi:MAG: flagellar hook-length control protein FliK [Paracoccaceae bacterium]